MSTTLKTFLVFKSKTSINPVSYPITIKSKPSTYLIEVIYSPERPSIVEIVSKLFVYGS